MTNNAREHVPFGVRLRRIGLKKAMGHDPFAPNCIWAEPWDYQQEKSTRKSCAEIARRFHL